MAAIIFTALCVVGCGFMVYVLVQWIQDLQPKAAGRQGDSQARDRKRLHIVSSRKTSRDDGGPTFRTEGQLVDGELSQGRLNSSLHDSERIAHQRIAGFLIRRKRA